MKKKNRRRHVECVFSLMFRSFIRNQKIDIIGVFQFKLKILNLIKITSFPHSLDLTRTLALTLEQFYSSIFAVHAVYILL